MDWWRLPGPEQFFERAIDFVRDGYNLVLPTPARGASGFADRLLARLANEGWSTIGPLTDHEGLAPLDFIFDSLGLEDNGNTLRSAATLRGLLEPGSILAIECFDVGRWQDWRRLIAEYETASRILPKSERPLIVLIPCGMSLKHMPERSAGLAVLTWQDVLGELDVLLFIRGQWREKVVDSRKARILARVVAKLALWDLPLAAFLCERQENELFDPAKVLSVAREEGVLATGIEESWESGGVLRFDGRERLHPALLLDNDKGRSELLNRLWEVQAAELLPMIELRRREWVGEIRSKITLPVRLGDEEFNDLDDLEIGQLAYLAKRRGLRGRIEVVTERLRSYRNKLAHLEVLDYSEVFDPDLLGR